MIRRFVPLLALCASACALGPRHPIPTVAPPPTPDARPIRPESGPAQTFVADAERPADWWTRFGSADLDALVARALGADNDLAVAEAALRQARAQASAASGAFWPQLDASAQSQRVKAPRALSNPLPDPDQFLYTLHSAQLSVSYPLDLFGANREKRLSAKAAAEVAAARLDAARTTVAANLTLAVIQNAALQAQIEAAEQSVRDNRELLAILQKRQALGEVGSADVAAQQTALATAEGALPPLVRQQAHQRALIAIFIGQAPGAPLPALPRLEALALPGDLPAVAPAAIVARRPDIRAADAQVRGAAADLGAAIAARLPNLQLTGQVGGESTRFSSLLGPDAAVWSLVGAATQPLFHGGQLRAQQKGAQAALDGAKAQYRAAVLQAFADVDDALTALRTDAMALDAADRAQAAAARNLAFTRRQLELGGAGTLSVLNASAAEAQARGQLIQARAARLGDTVAFFQAIGGPDIKKEHASWAG
ncbi:efflux transporter outer membrane subunit [uncultured Caulobacter sp.]|jgi:NodT family efflux transporter outer membrane factor (OMF) lipoprotein|uniref:efflux transporter outer membrane subunit n=1 Tax=uncultured Caulobacter sp. TaxID=158749 RepID=UPI00261DD20E|nr:efflux transporter outer membrane subunit [uncultured Caulobacter sp.]